MATQSNAAAAQMSAAPREGELFGHPKGLYILFFSELWERFSFYSMRGILVLYMGAMMTVAGARADKIYGAYLGFVYASTFIGGMLADRMLGQRRAIYIGGTLMAIAQFTLAAHAMLLKGGQAVESLNWMFFLGLGLLSAGNGFFKPNISTIVGTLYQQGDSRRDVAFTIFYMGINIGAFLASFSAGIAQKWGWHLGFLLAGSGMVLGQLIFTFGLGTIKGKGLPPVGKDGGSGGGSATSWLALAVGVAAFIPLAGWMISNPEWVQNLALIIAGPIVLYLLWEATRGTREEAGRMIVILVLCSFSMMFWGFFELAGSTITRFTEETVDRNLFGTEVPAAFLANFVNPLLIIVLSIPVAMFWVWLDKRRWEPASPFKFVMGLAQLGLGFLMLYFGAMQAGATGKAPMFWLILAFFFHTTGELCLSPVGLSTITKLSPARLVGMFMGVWFLSSALGNVLAPRVIHVQPGAGFGEVFKLIVIITMAGAAVLLILAYPLKKMMHGVK
ncbi:Di-/tripeptide transporter [Phycisphaerae bacterium RAS1]|nr:Di-/tripeptide transporter [Phycisphaerae bacterium RAS1]